MFSIGFKCYEYYTYSKNDHSDDQWEKKLSGIFHADYTNDDMQRGTQFESTALEVFAASGVELYRCGFIVNKHIPIFGYSPDALIFSDGEWRLVEVKCPKPQKSENELIVHCKRFLKRDENGEVQLKKKCPYYGQVQLGMFLTHTQKCHFLVHRVHEKQNIKINVDYHPNFVHDSLQNLVKVYFQRYLPYVQKYYN